MLQILTTYSEEQELLEQLSRGEKKALEWIYKHCFETTEKMVLKMNGSYDEAWDIFQEAVTVFYEKVSKDGVTLNCRINTYITSISKNLWLNRVKQLNKTARSIDDEFDKADTTKDVSSYIEKEQELERLMVALDKLGEPCSKLLKVFYFGKKNMQQITTEFGYTNTDNAKNQKYKCLNRLKKIFFDETYKEKINE